MTSVQQIKPRARTAWRESRPVPERPDDKDRDDDGRGRRRERPPPEPGTGEIVDRTV
jgi:hypothetical protein